MTFDLVLFYYNNPKILYNWFYRLVNHSDFKNFLNIGQVIIADTGTPWENIDLSLEIVNKQPDWIKSKIIYIRAETDDIRKKVPPEIDARPMCHVKNLIFFDISSADVIITSMIGQIFSPKYFNGHLSKHIQDKKAVVLPKRFDLISDTYHLEDFKKSWNDIIKGNIRPTGGWPDMSVRREWIIEIGGYDEDFITISPDDMDVGSRLTGKLDNGMPSEALFTFKKKFINLELNLYQPYYDDFFSLTCNTYPGHVPTDSPRRQLGYQKGIEIYLKKWGQIKRNANKISIQYKKLNFKNNEKL